MTNLFLKPMEVEDAEQLFGIFADPRMWWYDPGKRHRDLHATVQYVERAASRWILDGLSYWTVRLAEEGEIIGSGGAQRAAAGEWNLNYRIAPDHQRRGHATELLRLALAAADEVDPTVPRIAWVDEVNVASIRVAEKVGLRGCGLRGGASDGRPRLAFADRALDETSYGSCP